MGNAICIAIVLYLGLIVIQSARLGMSGLIVELGQREVDRWKVSMRPQGMREANRIAGYFTDSLGYAPGNPWALEGLGSLDLARVRLSQSPREALTLARNARQRTREALRQRPTSPFLWANLALSKVYLDQFDEEFFAALRNANVLGPWEPASQLSVLFAGLAAWDRLDADLRLAIEGVLERGGARNAEKMFQTVKTFRRFDLVCGRKDYHLAAGADCRNTMDKGKSGAARRKENR
jgi:hypothetical protein